MRRIHRDAATGRPGVLTRVLRFTTWTPRDHGGVSVSAHPTRATVAADHDCAPPPGARGTGPRAHSGAPAAPTRLAGVLELRIHGVSGTAPHTMLGLAEQTAAYRNGGDDLTGFYRAVEPGTASGPTPSEGAVTEAYSWGAMTSSRYGVLGWLRRALWLILLPFALANVALWARPDLQASGPRPVFAGFLVRLGALLLTALFAATLVGVGMDLVALQCLREGVSCSALPGLLGRVPLPSTTLPAGQRVVIGQLVPLAGLAVLWFLARSTRRNYEAWPPRGGTGAGFHPSPLGRPGMWVGESAAITLTTRHLAVGVLTVVAYTAPTALGTQPWLGWSIAVTVLVVALLFAPAPSTVERSGANPCWQASAPLVARAVLVIALVLLLLLSTRLWGVTQLDRDQLTGTGGIPLGLVMALYVVVALLAGLSRSWTMPALVVTGATAVTVLAVVPGGPQTLGSQRSLLIMAAVATTLVAGVLLHVQSARSADEQCWNGAAPAFLLGAAAGVSILFSTVTTLAVANVLNGDATVAELSVRAGGATLTAAGSGPSLTVPSPYVWFATALPVLVGVWVVVGAAIVVRDRRGPPPKFVSTGSSGLDRARSRALRRAGLAHRAEALLSAMALPMLLAAAVIVVGSLTGDAPWSQGVAAGVLQGTASAGLYLSVAVAGALVGLLASTRTSAERTRAIGVIWDLLTFWPRGAHPLAPPCYSERVVPEVVERVRSALALPGEQRVVLSGHSQGSTISVAVLLQLSRSDLSKVYLLSYGSQLRALFGRLFPAVLGPAVLGGEPTSSPSLSPAARVAPPTFDAADASVPAMASPGESNLERELGGDSPRWRNLYRTTDPLGHAVLSDRPNAVDQEVGDLLEAPADQVIQTHSSYPATPEYAAQLRRWFNGQF